MVQALAEKLGERYNLLPIAFSQNEDGDLKKLRAFLMQKKTPVSAVVNLMPFRLGAGPMGGDADQAVEILKELDVPYFNPFLPDQSFRGGMGAGGCRESRRVSYQHPASGAGRRDRLRFRWGSWEVEAQREKNLSFHSWNR
ncbi:MAG: cobaltochelatase subunit CobN [Blautia massiliensis (ex Durand et al. 2017)]